MTIKKKIAQIMKSDIDMENDSLEKLVYIAFYMGLEAGTKKTSDKYNQLLAEQKERAKKCRYHKLALEVQGDTDYIYSSDFSSDITSTFGGDETNL